MAGSFSGINLASNAIRSFQRGLDITGHNISNVNTVGYSRQTVTFAAVDGSTFWGNNPYVVGGGVTIDSINRIRDTLLDSRMSSSQSDMSKFAQLAESLKQVEGALNEPGPNGISDALNKFFDAWSALSSNPGDSAMKLQVQLTGQTLTQRVRATYANFSGQAQQANAAIASTFDEVDQLSSQIASLNKETKAKMASGTSPNDLMDLRSKAIEDLSKIIDIQTYPANDGSITVYSNQALLADTAGSIPIPRNYDANTQTLTGGATPVTIRSGRLVGLMQSLSKIESAQTQFDTLANTLRTQVNSIHRTGTNSQGNTNVNFFNDSVPQTGAINFDLSAEVKASPDAIASGVSGNAGDGGLALALSRLKETDISGLGNRSITSFYATTVSAIGRDTAYYAASYDTEEAVAAQIENQRQSVSGVSIDDEMANMLKFQRSYQAAARALSIFDQVTEDLINLIR